MTFSRDCFGPDVPASLTVAELTQLAEGVRFIGKMMKNPVDKDALASQAEPLRSMFMKSVVARTALPAGTVLRASDLTVKKPGTGIPAHRMQQLIGRQLRRPVEADELFAESDLVEPGVPAVA